MKKIILLSLLLSIFVSSGAFSSVKISIYNNSRYNCDLLPDSIEIKHGHLDSRPPVYLAPGSTGIFKLLRKSRGHGHGASIRLTYQCEVNHQITIFSYYKRDTSGRTENAINMRGVLRHTDEKINWTLETTN